MSGWQAYALMYGLPLIGVGLFVWAYLHERAEARERDEELAMLERLWKEEDPCE